MPCPLSSIVIAESSLSVMATCVAPDLRAFWNSSCSTVVELASKNWATLSMVASCTRALIVSMA